MVDNDIYDNKTKYENFLSNLEKLLVKPEDRKKKKKEFGKRN